MLTSPGPQSEFLTTRWSMIVRAGGSSGEALEELCRLYWKPLFAFARMLGQGEEDARDAVQDFFADLLANNYLSRADAARGRFRSFLLGAFKHKLRDAYDKRSAQKRGGGCEFVSLDAVRDSLFSDPGSRTPDENYDRQWALTVLAEAALRLRAEMERDGHARRFEVLEPFLSAAEKAPTYAEAGASLDVDADRVRAWIHRLRQRKGRIIREIVAETLTDPADLDDELRHLLAAATS